MQDSVMATMMIKLISATLFLTKRLTPSRKKVEEGRICTKYSFSSAVAGIKASTSRCILKGFFFMSTILSYDGRYSRVIRGSMTL